MKKQILLTAVAFFLCLGSLFAQAPELLNYQGIARNATGQPLANTSISLRLTIRTVAGNGVSQLRETHSVTTNNYGLYNVEIGGGTNISGSMSAVTWGSDKKFLQVELDPTGGTSYTNLGSTELLSVPYALHSANGAIDGTTNTVPIFTGPNSLGNSLIRQNSSDDVIVGSNSTPSSIITVWPNSGGNNTFYEGSYYRGYIGSYSGANADMDFGTGNGNTAGSVHLTIEAVPKFTLDSNGRIGLGTITPDADLDITQSASPFPNPTTGGIKLNGGAGNWQIWSSSPYLSFARNGTRVAYVNNATGAWVATSDARFKKNITSMPSVLNRVNKMNVVEYQYKHQTGAKDKDISLGFLAQEVKPLFPELIRYQEDGDKMGLNYAEFGVLAIKAIQEQQALIEKLTKRIEALEAK